MIAELIKIESDLNFKVGVGVNNIDYKRKMTVVPFKGCVVAKNQLVCNMEGKQQKESYDIVVNFKNNNYKISFWEQASNVKTISSIADMVGKMIKDKSIDAMSQTILPKIYDVSENQIGNVEYVSVKGEKLQSYYYYKISLNNMELKCYEVGFGSKGIFFIMYDMQDNLVAEVSKRMKVKNGKSSYTLYIKNEEWFEIVSLTTIILHQTIFDKEEDNFGLGSQGYALNTFQQELKNKYSQNFIDAIIASEDPKNLPENMPLVAEKIKESQNTFVLKFRKISFIIFIIFLILIFLYAFLK